MRLSLSMKTLFRTPFKTLLTFLLIAATSYMLCYNVAEYAVMTREFNRVADFYQGVGAVESERPRESIPDTYWDGKPSFVNSGAYPVYRPFPAYVAPFYLYSDERVEFNPYGEEIRDNKYTGLLNSEIETIANLPYITNASVRYMTAGISDTLRRSDKAANYFGYTGRFVMEATFLEYEPRSSSSDEHAEPARHGEAKARSLFFGDIVVLAGEPNWYHRDFVENPDGPGYSLPDISRLSVWASEFTPDNPDGSLYLNRILLEANTTRFYISIPCGESFYNEVYSHDFLKSLVPGERYVIIGRTEPLSYSTTQSSYGGGLSWLSDTSTLNWWPQVYPVGGLQDGYLELDEFAPLREMIEITNNDLRTLDVVYTDDMSSIMRFAERKMIIREGRMLTIDDSENMNNVCVMNQVYMQENRLNVGDRISLKLGDVLFEQNAAIGAVASVRERYAGAFTDEIEFEIVGAYRDIDSERLREQDIYWTYSPNTVFVPLPFLPCEVPNDHVARPGEFSFAIGDARDISAFLDEARPIIEGNLGLTMFWSDGGWLAIEKQYDQAGIVGAVRLPLFCLAVLVAISLTVYLFIMRKRKEYAIMRSLGTPKAIAGRSLFVPLGIIGAAALLLGNILAYVSTGGAIEGALSAYTELELEVNASISIFLVLACTIGEAAVLTLVTVLGLKRIGSKPPLELLQAAANKGALRDLGSAQMTAAEPAKPNIVRADAASPAHGARIGAGAGGSADGNADGSIRGQPLPGNYEPLNDAPYKYRRRLSGARPRSARKTSAMRHVARYVVRHVRRSRAKSALSVGLALLLVGTICQFAVLRGMYTEMYETLEVKAYFLNGLRVRPAANLDASGYVRDPYYEKVLNFELECDFEPITVVMTNDMSRFIGEAPEIEFLEGYDSASLSVITSSGNRICVIAGAYMDEMGISLGDTLRLNRQNLVNLLDMKYMPGIHDTEQRIMTLERVKQEELDDLSAFYTVVGRLASKSGQYEMFLPVGSGLENVLEEYGAQEDRVFDFVEYTLASARDVEQFRELALDSAYRSVGGAAANRVVIDSEEAENMQRTVDLLDVFYPIAAAIALLIGGLFPGLIVMQSEREAAIMRSLGTTKKRTRAVLASEQAILCAAGILCAAAALFAINGVILMLYSKALSAYVASHLAACTAGALACAVIVTRRRVLDLLQVKE